MLATPLPPPSNGAVPPQASTPEDRAQLRRQTGERFRAAAERAKAFREQYPDSVQAAEAKQIEAKSLLNAALAGDNSQEARASSLVAEIRRDERLPAKVRMQTAALANIVSIRPMARERVKYLAAHEQAARDLIAEFPAEAGAYEGLLRLAENHPEDAEAVRIAGDVVRMAPMTKVKADARVVLDRHALVGQSLRGIVEQAIGQNSAMDATVGRGVILYTWSVLSPGSVAMAKNLAKSAPATVRLVGINLDQDVAGAQGMASDQALPGDQLYDARGLEGPLAQALKLRRAGEVYVADSRGVIRSVSAQRGDLTGKLGYAGQ